MYANTAGLALNTWRVRLYFQSSLLGYVRFEQNSDFNTATPSSSTGEVSWLATGVKSTTTDAQVSGTAIYLLRIQMRVASSVAAGTYDSNALGLYPRATELISGAAFVQDVDGQVFDGRDTVQAMGQLIIVESDLAGIFAYLSNGKAVNMEGLTGTATTYGFTIVGVGSDDRVAHESSVMSSASCCTCSSSEPHTVFLLSGCAVELGSSQTTTKAGVNVSIDRNGFTVIVSFDVYTPQVVNLTLDDSVLNRFAGSSGGVLEPCSANGRTAYPYQRTRVKAYVDGLDATPLVSFATHDSSVAQVWDQQYDVIEGKQVGLTTAHLNGRVGRSPSAVVSVSDVLVSASELVVRVITGASWSADGRPASQYSFGSRVLASAEVSNVMTAEGHSGRMFSRVVWSDGHEEDVGCRPSSGIDEVRALSGSSGVILTAPSGHERFWRAEVAVGAMKECVTTVNATWSVCGTAVTSGMVPLYLNLPDPTAARITIRESRLTPVGNDANLSPINVRTASALQVVVDFDDGTSRTMSSDGRITYSTSDLSCASVDNAADTVTILESASCTSVMALATVQLGSFRFQ
eukprot:5912064-Prymnesium_polylepis.1